MAASSEELTVLVALRDEMSAGLAKIREEVGTLSKTIDAQRSKLGQHSKATQGYSKNLNAMSKAFANFGSLGGGSVAGGLTRTGSALDKLSRTKAVGTLSALSAGADTFAKKIDLHDKLTGLSRDLEGAAVKVGKLTAGFAAGSVALGAFGLKAAASLQQTQLGLQTQLGSASAGNAVMNQIKAQTGIFSTSTLAQGALSMLQNDTPGAVVARRLSALQNIAATTANPGESLQNAIAAINSIQHTGRITSQGLDSLAAAGVPGYAILSQDTGKSKLQVAQMVNQNRYSAQAFLNQLTNLSGPVLSKYRGGAQRDATQTLGGMWNTLKNQAQLTLANAASPLTRSLQAEMPALKKTVNSLLGTLAPFGVKLLGSLIKPLGQELPIAMAKIQPLLPQMEAGFSKFASAALKLLPSLVQLGSDFAPVLPTMINFATDLAKLLDPMLKLLDKSPLLRDAMAGLLLSLLAFNKLSGVVGAIRGFASAISVLAEKLGVLTKAEKAEGLAHVKESAEDMLPTGGVGKAGTLGKVLSKGAPIGGAALEGTGLGAAGTVATLAAPPAIMAYAVNSLSPQQRKKAQTVARQARAASGQTKLTGYGMAVPGYGGTPGKSPLEQAMDAAAAKSKSRPASSPSTTSPHTTVAVSGAPAVAANVTQNITIHAQNMTPQQLTNAVAKANRDALHRAGNSKSLPVQTMHHVGNTGTKG